MLIAEKFALERQAGVTENTSLKAEIGTLKTKLEGLTEVMLAAMSKK